MKYGCVEPSLIDQKLEMATEGLEAYFLKHLKLKLSPANAFTIAEYISSMKVETKEIDVIIIPNTGYTLKTYT